MFRVDYRYSGQGLWNMPGLPVSMQAAVGQARATSGGLIADEVRVVASRPAAGPATLTPNAVDMLV